MKRYFLSKRREAMTAGEFVEEFGQIPRISPKERDKLFHQTIDAKNIGSREYIRLRRTFVSQNLTLAIDQCKKYSTLQIPFGELVDEATIGLIKAVDRFDLSFNVRFSTYAIRVIKSQLNRYINRNLKQVGMPHQVAARRREFLNMISEFHNENGREPNVKEISDRLKITTRAARAIKDINSPMIYLDKPALMDKRKELSTVIEDEKGEDETTEPDSKYDYEIRKAEMYHLIDSLESREKEIIQRTYGLNGYTPESQVQIGKVLNFSRERIRQLHDKTIYKLKERARIYFS